MCNKKKTIKKFRSEGETDTRYHHYVTDWQREDRELEKRLRNIRTPEDAEED